MKITASTAYKPISNSFSDSFEFTRTQPRSRKARDVVNGNIETPEFANNGTAVIYIAIGSAILMISSLTLAIYVFKNNRKLKHKSVTVLATKMQSPC